MPAGFATLIIIFVQCIDNNWQGDRYWVLCTCYSCKSFFLEGYGGRLGENKRAGDIVMCGRLNSNLSLSFSFHFWNLSWLSFLCTQDIEYAPFYCTKKITYFTLFCCLLFCLFHINRRQWLPLPFVSLKRCIGVLFKAFIDEYINLLFMCLALCRWLWCYKPCVSWPFATETRLQVGILLTSTLTRKIVYI